MRLYLQTHLGIKKPNPCVMSTYPLIKELPLCSNCTTVSIRYLF